MNSRTFRLGFVLALGIVATAAAHNQMVSRGRGGSGSAAATTPATAGVATSGPLSLCVDPNTGDDGNSCACGTPCVTIQKAVDKIPFEVRHPVNVYVDGGTFAGFALVNHSFNPASAATGAYINIAGAAQTNTTPATGTATGTLTAVTTDAVNFHVLTDAAQTWTVNDTNITTRFLTLVSGTGAGQSLPIFANTATTISVVGQFSPAPVAGTTYAITTPSTLLNTAAQFPATAAGAAANAGAMLFGNLAKSRVGNFYAVSVQDIGKDSGAFALLVSFNSAVNATRVRNAVNVTISTFGGANVRWFQSTNSGGPLLSLTSSTAPYNYLAVTQSYSTGTAQALLMTGAGSNETTIIQSQIETSSATVPAIDLAGHGNGIYLNNGRVRCTAASTNTGIHLYAKGTPSTGVLAGTSTLTLLGTQTVETCGTGLSVEGPVSVVADNALGALTFLSNTLAVSAKGGGRVAFGNTVPTFTTNTTDLSVDGTTSTRAAFVALTPNSMIDLNYLSAVYLQP